MANGWPNAYSIVGSKALLQGLTDIAGLRIEDHGQAVREDGSLAVIAYASAAAAAQAEARGCIVTLRKTGALQEQEANDEIAGRTGPDAPGIA